MTASAVFVMFEALRAMRSHEATIYRRRDGAGGSRVARGERRAATRSTPQSLSRWT